MILITSTLSGMSRTLAVEPAGKTTAADRGPGPILPSGDRHTKTGPTMTRDFHFDTTISRAVLENYLSRSISFTELLHDDLTSARNSRGVDPRDNIRLLL